MANFAAPGFSAGYARGASIRNQRDQLAAARAAQSQSQGRASLEKAQAGTAERFNAILDAAKQAAGAGATPEQLAEFRRGAEATLMPFAQTLGAFTAAAIAKQVDPTQAGIPDPEDFISENMRVFDAELSSASIARRSPAQEGTEAADAKMAEARRLAESLSVPVERVAEAMGLTPEPDETGGPFQGTGMMQQSANQLIALGNKARKGEALSDEERAAYSIAYAELTAPRVVGSPQTGFNIIEPEIDPRYFPSPESIGAQSLGAPQSAGSSGAAVPSQGARVTPLTERRQTPEQGGRAAMIEQATKTIRGVRDAIVRPDGTIDQRLVASFIMNAPFTEGRKFRAQFEDASAAKLRAETGAQANEDEIQNIVDRFMPGLFDNDETKADKLNRMVEFFETALRNTDPELFGALTERSANAPEAPADEPDAIFQGFDPSTGYAVFKRPDGSYFAEPVNDAAAE